MTKPDEPSPAKKEASFRSRFVTYRTLVIVAVIAAVALIMLFPPW